MTESSPLAALGLRPIEEATYRELVARPAATTEELAAALDTSLPEADAALASLHGLGLAARSGGRYIASSPTFALGPLVTARRDQLRRAELELANLAAHYRADRRQPRRRRPGRGGQRRRRDQPTLRAAPGGRDRRGAGAGQRHHARGEPGRQHRRDRRTGPRRPLSRRRRAGGAGRGRRHRRRGHRAGGRRRGTRRRPGPDQTGDRRPRGRGAADGRRDPTSPPRSWCTAAACSTRCRPSSTRYGTAPGHSRSAPAAPWTSDRRTARCFRSTARCSHSCSPGLTDRAIASQLGMSMRTVQRRVQRMMELAGVRTRMQLGWYAAQSEWT